eukprot:GHVU01054304.1.p1 GENE.GHVU01054304.1~~GHVU01054304.1.p1  ORF type:complete len:115 (-),score=1.77 GHVU01054304.1:383-727(-)
MTGRGASVAGRSEDILIPKPKEYLISRLTSISHQPKRRRSSRSQNGKNQELNGALNGCDAPSEIGESKNAHAGNFTYVSANGLANSPVPRSGSLQAKRLRLHLHQYTPSGFQSD